MLRFVKFQPKYLTLKLLNFNKSFNQKDFQNAKKYAQQVSKIQIPIEIQQQSKIKQIIQQKRQQIFKNLNNVQFHQDFKYFLAFAALPVVFCLGSSIAIYSFQQMQYLSYLHNFIVKNQLFNIFLISGLEIGRVIIDHSLSINTIKTSKQNIARILLCLGAPLASTLILTYNIDMDINGLFNFIFWYLAFFISKKINVGISSSWYLNYLNYLIYLNIGFIIIYNYLFQNTDPKLMRSDNQPNKIKRPQSQTLKLSEIK